MLINQMKNDKNKSHCKDTENFKITVGNYVQSLLYEKPY